MSFDPCQKESPSCYPSCIYDDNSAKMNESRRVRVHK